MLAEKHGMDKKDAEGFVKEFFQLIEESLESDKYVKIRGLGTFKLIDVDSRESVNISTGERFQIQGHTKVSFTPEPSLKDVINKPFSHFETVVLNDETVLDDTPVEGGAEEEDKEEDTPSEPATAPLVESFVEENVVVDDKQVIETAEEVTVVDEVTEAAEEIIESEEAIDEIVEEPDEIDAPDAVEEEIIEPDAVVEPPLNEEEPVQQEEIDKEEESVIEETQETPVNTVSEPPTTDDADKKDNSTLKFFIGIVVFVVLLCVGAVAFMYYPDLFDGERPASSDKNIADEKVEKPASHIALTDSIIRNDTALIAKEDTVSEVAISKTTAATPPEKEIKKKDTQKPAAVPVKPDSLSYKIVGTKATYTIKEGETLTKVALRFYGTKTLWPYIVKHNPDVIKNPDHVPYGTVVKIPELMKK